MDEITADKAREITKQSMTYNSPLYEYVEAVKFGEGVDKMFALRIANIDTSRKQKYLDTTEVQDTLRAFHLDSEKFWYLCLFMKDFVEGYADGIDAITPLEEIKQLVTILNDIDSDLKMDGEYCLTSNAQLSLKVGKKFVKVNNPLTLGLIKGALFELSLNNKGVLLNNTTTNMVRIHKKPIYKIALFSKYLSWFLKDKVADKTINASKDKSLLISRMIFVLGISDDESFFDEYKDDGSKLDYLKNYIKKYKDIEVPTYNSHYPIYRGLYQCCF